MKKMKKILLVVLCLMILPFQVRALESYKELDKKNIHMPTTIWPNNDNKFYIYNYENYNLYYQYQLLDKETASKIESLRKEGNTLSKEEINNKKEECDILKEKYNADKTEENRTAYNTCITELNALVDAYNNRVDEINEEMFALYLDYDDSKWIQSKDNKFNGSIEGLTEDTMAILWVKLVDNDTSKTVYNAADVTLQKNKITTDKTDTKVNVNKVSNQEKNPNTKDYNVFILVAVGIVAMIGLSICTNKLKKAK